MGEVVRLRMPEVEAGAFDLKVDLTPLADVLGQTLAIADSAPDHCATLRAYLERVARGIEELGYFRVEVLPGPTFQLTAHPAAALDRLFETPKGAA